MRNTAVLKRSPTPFWLFTMALSGSFDALGGLIGLAFAAPFFYKGQLFPGFLISAIAVALWGITGQLFLEAKERGRLKTGQAYSMFAAVAGPASALLAIAFGDVPENIAKFSFGIAFCIASFVGAWFLRDNEKERRDNHTTEMIAGYIPSVVLLSLSILNFAKLLAGNVGEWDWLVSVGAFIFLDVSASYAYTRWVESAKLSDLQKRVWAFLLFLPTGVAYMILLLQAGNLVVAGVTAAVASMAYAVFMEKIVGQTSVTSKPGTWIVLILASVGIVFLNL